MAYATVEDLIARFGEVEIIRLSASEGQLDDQVNALRCGVALADATATIDSYVRGRYAVPLSPVPREILAACCTLARYDLARGEQKTPSAEMKEERSATVKWLEMIAGGKVLLDGASPNTASGIAGARTLDRARDFVTGPGLP